MTIGDALVAVIALLVALTCGSLALKVLLGSKSEYDRNRQRTLGPLKTMKGTVSMVFDHERDHRVAAGVAVDKRRKRVVNQGKLSDDAIESATKP